MTGPLFSGDIAFIFEQRSLSLDLESSRLKAPLQNPGHHLHIQLVGLDCVGM